MNEINELIEALIIDIAEEGVGATAGVGLLWGVLIGGGAGIFAGLLQALSSMT